MRTRDLIALTMVISLASAVAHAQKPDFGTPAEAATYTVTLEAAGKKLSKPLTLLEDVWMREER